MDKESIKVRVKLELDDYIGFNKVYAKSKSRVLGFFKWGCLSYIGLFGILLVIFTFYNGPDNNDVVVESTETVTSFASMLPTIVSGITMIALLIGIPIFLKKSTKKHFESNKKLQVENEYSFSEENVKIESESLNSTYRWDDLFKVLETKKSFGLFDNYFTHAHS